MSWDEKRDFINQNLVNKSDEEHFKEKIKIIVSKVEYEAVMKKEKNALKPKTKQNIYEALMKKMTANVWLETTFEESSRRFSSKSVNNMNGKTKIEQALPFEGQTFSCHLCEIHFPNVDEFKNHNNQNHRPRPFICNYQNCEKTFAVKSNFLIHKRKHEENTSICDECDEIFISKKDLKRHKCTHGNKYYCCEECGLSFTNDVEWKKHKKKHKRIETRKSKIDEEHPCPHCEKVYSEVAYLNRHLKVHSGTKEFNCEHCFKAFTELSTLKQHLRTHTGEKPYTCQHCGKKLSDAGNLKQHLRIHTGEKPYVCDVCRKGFTKKCNLDVHKRIHTGERPYACDFCERKFIENVQLKRHKLKEHGL